jgi:large subunit ribosomal protein L32e
MTEAEPKKPAAKKKAKKKARKKVKENKPQVKESDEKPPAKKSVKKKVKKKATKKVPADKKSSTEKKAVKKKAKKKAAAEEDDADAGAEAPVAEAVEKKEKPKFEIPVVKIKNLPKEGESKAKRKPRFMRQELNKLPRLADKWRKPRGIDSKKHEKKRGKGRLPSIGFKGRSGESGLHYGFEAVRVFNASELAGIDPKKQALVIASSVGRRKRNMIISKANELKITILNPRAGER